MNDIAFSDVSSNVSDLSYISDLDFDIQSYNYDLSNGSPVDINNFNIVHFNINSITADDRLEQLSDICSILNLDVLISTESKLDNTIPTSMITLRRDRNRHGGGVLIYIAEHLIFNQREQLQSDNFEHIWVDVKLRNTSFAINTLYRPPNETTLSHELFLSTATKFIWL